MSYNANNWYWIVGGDETEVYSSASRAFVPPSDATYAAWRASGGQPSRIVSNAELSEVVNKPVADQIAAVELKQVRALREQALGVSGALARLQAFDTEIATLRTQLASLT
jgi:hypothetical protein